MTKFDRMWLAMCSQSSALSNCPRLKCACILVNPARNTPIAFGYNGAARNCSKLCGGDTICLRDVEQIESGKEVQIGCVHAEMNAICNAAAQGTSTTGAHAYITGYPCLMCAKLLHQAGIVKVYMNASNYSEEGKQFLRSAGVECIVIFPSPMELSKPITRC